MKKLIWSDGSGVLNLSFTRAQVYSVPCQGSADEAVHKLSLMPSILIQFAFMSDSFLRSILRPYGAWEDKELEDRQDNIHRLIWIACLDIQEEEFNKNDM